jgi:L,D-transpeptidase YcbB
VYHFKNGLISSLLLFLLCACQTPMISTSATDNLTPAAKLQVTLQSYQAEAAKPWAPLPNNIKNLRLGDKNIDIALLRQRLKVTKDLASNTIESDEFDQVLLNAIKVFQWRHGLKSDGVIGNDTLAELNIPTQQRIQQIQLNIKRWEQLSSHLSNRYILVNIPEYQLHLIDNNKEVITMKVIIGKPTRKTPELSSMITHLVLNPYWSVPKIISQQDIVPKVIADPEYLKKENIRIFKENSYGSSQIASTDINWEDAKVNGFKYFLRQDPGVNNALGQVKFEFDNIHSVYLHDTPHKELFTQNNRDLSSGCVRLEYPLTLVSYLVPKDETENQQRVFDLINSKKNSYFTLKHPIPIHITYITSWVDSYGYLHFAPDIYKKDFAPSTQ